VAQEPIAMLATADWLGSPQLEVALAASAGELEAAQLLRHRVFVEEMGARVAAGRGGREHDLFDPWCDHVIVRERASGRIVGTYRLLSADKARRLGTFCLEREFDLTRLNRLRPQLLELGRACVDPEFRSGAVVMLLWAGIARLMRERGAAYLIGCASVSMSDGGLNAAAVYAHIRERHLAPIEYRVFPRTPLEAHGADALPAPLLPPLVKGYLRVGAWVGGAPAWDADFNTADLLMFLPLARVEARYARHFLPERAAA
jgi:putative hemolysin